MYSAIIGLFRRKCGEIRVQKVSSEVWPSLNVYSKFELSLSVSGTCAYQIKQLCAHTSD